MRTPDGFSGGAPAVVLVWGACADDVDEGSDPPWVREAAVLSEGESDESCLKSFLSLFIVISGLGLVLV